LSLALHKYEIKEAEIYKPSLKELNSKDYGNGETKSPLLRRKKKRPEGLSSASQGKERRERK